MAQLQRPELPPCMFVSGIKHLRSARTIDALQDHWGFALSMVAERWPGQALKHHRRFEIHCFKGSVLVHLRTARVGHAIEAQTVLRHVHFGQQAPFECLEFSQGYLAFKDRFLYALAGPFADFGNASQSAPAGLGFSTHVIADDYQHAIPFNRLTVYLTTKGT